MNPCPVCSSASFQHLFRCRPNRPDIPGTYSVVQCRVCRAEYLGDPPPLGVLNELYRILHDTTNNREDSPRRSTPTIWLVRFWRRWNGYPVGDAIDCGPVLDVGCGSGALLAELSARGIVARGVDWDSQAISLCQRSGLDATVGDISSGMFEVRKYRWVVFSHVLEHLHDPIRVLQNASSLLEPAGKLLICVPNSKSPCRYIFGHQWHGWDAPFHFIHYDTQSLTRICSAAGLRVTRVVRRVLPDDFRRSWIHLTGRDGRYVAARLALLPVTALMSTLGFGSFLLVTATST